MGEARERRGGGGEGRPAALSPVPALEARPPEGRPRRRWTRPRIALAAGLSLAAPGLLFVALGAFFAPAGSPASRAGARASGPPSASVVSIAPIAPIAAADQPAPGGSDSDARREAEDAGADAAAEAATWVAALREAHRGKRPVDGAKALLALAEIDPGALSGLPMRLAAADLSSSIAIEDPELALRVYEALATRFGSDGPDVIYEVVRLRGGTRAADMLGEVLKRQDVRERASSTLRTLLALAEAPCNEKPEHVAAAAAEGDGRTLALLASLRGERCDPRVGGCCLPHDPEIEEAVRDLARRLRPPGPRGAGPPEQPSSRPPDPYED